MQIQTVSYEGWPHNAALSNNHVELIITLDVGPRIISYRTPRSHNVFKTYAKQLGGSGEGEWMIRGGHRLWVAPEAEVSYALDNSPVSHEMLPNGIRMETAPIAPWGLRKILTVTLAEDSSEVIVHHKVVNESNQSVEISTWGLSVMAPGGLEIIPLAPVAEHPGEILPLLQSGASLEGFLPNRLIVPWPYTDMTDPRLRFGSEFITLRQTHDDGPIKLGLSHKEKWAAYLNGETLFVKTFDYVKGAAYTDLGCNFETYSNEEMLEIETLSPLRTLQRGEAVEHTEKWYLLGDTPQPPSLHEEDLGEWIAPLLEKLGV